MVRKLKNLQAGRLTFAALLALFVIVGAIAAANIVIAQIGYAASQKEYEELRRYAPPTSGAAVTASPSSGIDEAGSAAILGPATEPEPLPNLSAINPDYIGWIRIAGTEIDYPVARGADNGEYLSTTFSGKKNASGAIFMDSRCADGFDGFALLYGHNMKDGSMFAGLNRYRESGYREEHPEITMITANGEILTYSIFAVKETDVNDTAYTLPGKDRETVTEYTAGLGAPESAERLLILSTCVNRGSGDARLLVFAVGG
jgi:SrtB family sortase